MIFSAGYTAGLNEERRVSRIPALLLESYRVFRCVGLTGTRALNNVGDSDCEGDTEKLRKVERKRELGNVTFESNALHYCHTS